MNKFKICGACRNFYCGKCILKEELRDCLDRICNDDDFKPYFDKGD